MRLTRIYTRAGDNGSTSLADGSKIAKHDIRIEAYGNVDELNSFVGLLIDELKSDENLKGLGSQLSQIQHELFDLGGELATPESVLDPNASYLLPPSSITRLESEIDIMNQDLPPLKNFVLPGGHRGNSLSHVCRTICRRAERMVVQLKQQSKVRDEPVSYLNRLSDWFFVLSRHINHKVGVPEVLWNQRR